MGARTVIEGPALAAAVPPLNLPDFIRAGARQRPGQVALLDGDTGVQLTYGELDHAIGRCAAGWAACGLRPGDVLLMFAPNSPDWPVAAFGAMAAGGVVSGANPGYGAADLARQLRDCGARFVFTAPVLLATVREAVAGIDDVRIVLTGDAAGCIGFAGLLACDDAEPAGCAAPDALAALPYSSGTTGMPKGVMLSHRALVTNIRQYTQVWPTPAGAVMLAFLPMFHITGFTIVTLCGLATGAKVVTLGRFEPASFLQAIATHRVSYLSTVPPVMQFLALHPLVDAHDLSSLEMVGCGAAPLGEALERKVAGRLECQVGQGFGMTESSGCITVNPPRRVRPGSSGCLLPGTQARVVDPASGADLPPGTPGELWFRGPQAFTGYWRQPAATQETLTADGWVRTGDLGVFDADGYLSITGRLKELIKVKGFQVAPAELEALLAGHPAVVDAAVIGRPDERAGELPVAYVVTRTLDDGSHAPERIQAWAGQHLADYKQLAEVVACAAIPKSAAGKILRQTLRAQDAQRMAQKDVRA
ncbi:MAG: AMP-binding protein [Pseudomonadota bacterium]